MAEPVPSPIIIPTVTLTQLEIEETQQQIAEGKLPPDWLDRYNKGVVDNVFGFDHKKDRQGNPIEQGIGSKGHETKNHFAALKKAEQMGLEPAGAYDRAVGEIWGRDPDRAQKLGLPKPNRSGRGA